MLIDEQGKPIGKATTAPIIKLDPGQRISVRISDFMDTNPRPMFEHFHQKGTDAMITTTDAVMKEGKYWHEFQLVGDDPKVVNEMLDEIFHLFGAINIDIQKPLLPELKSFLERLKYLLGWLLHGK